MQQKIEQFIKQFIKQGKEYFQSLTQREKIVLLAVGAVLSASILIGGVLSPMMSYRAKLDNSVSVKDDQLRKVYELSARIKAVTESTRNNGAMQSANFTLFGFLEELAAKIKVNDRIEYMKPVNDMDGSTREAVEVKIRSVYQEDLISLLYDIEHCPYSLVIKRMNIRRIERDSNLDVILEVVRYG